MRLCLCVLLMAAAAGAQDDRAFTIEVRAPENRLTVGGELQLSVVVRDRLGRERKSDIIVWQVEKPAVLEVTREGLVRARSVGVSQVSARVPDSPAFHGMMMQALPKRVEMVPASASFNVGEKRKFEARAYDLRDQLIPNIAWQWEVLHDSDFRTIAASADNQGNVEAYGAGYFRVRAWVDFPTGGATLQRRLEIVAPIRVTPVAGYDLQTLWRSGQKEARLPFRAALLPSGDVLRGNDSGQLVLHAALGDLSNALLLYDKGEFRVLSAGGEPSPDRTGSTAITSWENAAINNLGEVVARVIGGGETHLALHTSAGSWPVHINGASIASNTTESWSNQATISRYARNARGDMVYTADTRKLNSPFWLKSVFRQNQRGQQFVIATTDEALPGAEPPLQFNQFFNGAAGDGAVYFFVRDAAGRDAVYREFFERPVRVVGTGDEMFGSRVRRIFGSSPPMMMAGENGDFVAGVQLETDAVHYLRYPNGRTTAAPQNLQVNCQCGIFSTNEAGTLVWAARGASRGLLLWDRSGNNRFVLTIGQTLGDMRVDAIDGASMDAAGRVHAVIRTPQLNSVLVEVADPPRILLKDGDLISASIPTSLRALFPGARQGAPLLQTGAGSWVWARESLPLAIAAGSRLASAGDALFNPSGAFQQSPDGSLLFANNTGHFLRLTEAGVEQVRPGGPVLPGLSFSWAVRENAAGQQIWYAGSNDGTRLYMSEGGEHRILLGLNPAQPPTIQGQPVADHWGAELDERGRVFCNVRLASGLNAIAIWQDGQWQFLYVPQRTNMGRFPVAFLDQLRQEAGRLLARVGIAGGSVVGEWTGSEWRAVTNTDDLLPNGRPMGGLQRFDVNRRGDVLVVTSFGPGWSAAVRRGNRWLHLVDNWEYFPDGDMINMPVQVELLDEGVVFMLASTVRGELRLLRAVPK